jgi:hypothetical protein
MISVAAVAAVTFGDIVTPLRPVIALWFLLIIPGLAFVRLLQIGEYFIEIPLALALSLAIDAIVAGVMLYAGAWSPKGILAVLLWVSIVGAVLQVIEAHGKLELVRPYFSDAPFRWGRVLAVAATLLLALLAGVVVVRLNTPNAPLPANEHEQELTLMSTISHRCLRASDNIGQHNTI